MEQVLAHLKEYQFAYVVLVLCVLPILFVTRRYSIPLILYTIEVTIYLCIIHLAMWVGVGLTRWFKEQSSMRALQQDGRPLDAPDWSTPLLEFWKRDLYRPDWIVWVELAAVCAVIILVFRYRPMKLQRKRGWHFTDKTEKRGARGVPRAKATPAAGRPGGKRSARR